MCPQAAGQNSVKDDGATVPMSPIVKAPNLNVGLPAVQYWDDDPDRGAKRARRLEGCKPRFGPRDSSLVLEGNANALTLESGTKEA